jgi:hypothetical protein
VKRIEEEKKSEESEEDSESSESSSSEEEEEPEESEGMKKVGKKSINARRLVKSTNKKAPKVSHSVTVKDAKAASKKSTKKSHAKVDDDEEDEEMTHTEVNLVSEEAAEEQINTQSKGRVKKAPAKRASSVAKVG